MVFNEIKLLPKLTSPFIYIYFRVLSPDSSLFLIILKYLNHLLLNNKFNSLLLILLIVVSSLTVTGPGLNYVASRLQWKWKGKSELRT